MKKKYVILFIMLLTVFALCGCGNSSDTYSEETTDATDPIYNYDFTGYYYGSGSIYDDQDQEEEYNYAVSLLNGDYDSSSTDLDFEFQIIDEYTADKNDNRVSVEIDRDNYVMRLIDNYGDIEYYDIIYVEDTGNFVQKSINESGDFIFLRTHSNGGSPFYYVTKAREGY